METSSTPQVGQSLPPFSLPAVAPEQNFVIEKIVGSDDLRGQMFVLFFYPKDATCGCTLEVCGFRDLYEEFQSLDIQVFGVSRDKISAHKKFIQNQNLPFALLSDDGAQLIKSWDLLKNATMYGKPVTKVLRTTFLMDANGIVRQIWNNVQPIGHAQEVLQAARELKL